MEGKIECKKPRYIKSCKEWITYIAKEDPEFVLGAFRKLWYFICSNTKNINKDELADKIGLTEDEFNFFTSMTLF